MSTLLTKLLARLSFRERMVITLRYGLDGLAPLRNGRYPASPARLLREVASILGCTSQCVQQIERGAIEQLRFLVRLSRLVADARALPPPGNVVGSGCHA